MNDVPIIFEHIERYLGPVNASWIENLDGEKCPFQVLRCAGRVVDTTFFCTLGLSNYLLPAHPGHDGLPTRHELLMAVPRTFGTRNAPPLLQQLGAIALSRQRAFAPGEVLMGDNPVFDQWPFRGFYASAPCVIEDDAFAECARGNGQPVQFVWMAPLYQAEIEFARKNGPAQLEDLFVAQQVDLVDLNRQPTLA